MLFQVTIKTTSEIYDKITIWEIQVPKPEQTRGSLERVSEYIRETLHVSHTGEYPQIESSDNGICIRFEGHPNNFQVLGRVLEWLRQPRSYMH